MDFKGIWENIKEKLSPLVEKVREFYEENKMLSYIIAGSLIGAFGSVLSTRVHLRYRAANM